MSAIFLTNAVVKFVFVILLVCFTLSGNSHKAKGVWSTGTDSSDLWKARLKPGSETSYYPHFLVAQAWQHLLVISQPCYLSEKKGAASLSRVESNWVWCQAHRGDSELLRANVRTPNILLNIAATPGSAGGAACCSWCLWTRYSCAVVKEKWGHFGAVSPEIRSSEERCFSRQI